MPETDFENPAREAGDSTPEERGNSIGREIRRRRRALDLTQEQVAKHVGVAKSNIGHWESGATSIRLEYAIKLAEILQCDAEDILYPDATREFNDPSRAIPRKRYPLDNSSRQRTDKEFIRFDSRDELLMFASNLALSTTRAQRDVIRAVFAGADAMNTEGADESEPSPEDAI